MAKRRRKKLSRWELVGWALALAVLVMGAVFVSIDVFMTWDHDAGYYLQRSYWISQGFRPYLDFGDGYAPLHMVLNALPMILGFPPKLVVYLIPFTWIAANALLTYLLAFALRENRAQALLVAGLYFFFVIDNQGAHVTLEHGVTFFSLLGLYLIKTGKGARACFLAGACAAAAGLNKQIGVLSLLPMIGMLIAGGGGKLPFWRKLGWGVLGFLAPVFLVLVWLGFDFHAIKEGHFDIFLKFVARRFNYEPPLDVLFRDSWRSPVNLVLLAGAVLLGLLDFVRFKPVRGNALTAGALAGLVLFYWPRFQNNYYHYTLNCWACVTLLLCLPQRFLPKERWAAVPLAMLVYGSFNAKDNIHNLEWIHYFDRWDWAGMGELHRVFFPVADAIRAQVPRGSPILILGEEPVLEYLAQATPQDRNLGWGTKYDDIPDVGNLTVVVEQPLNREDLWRRQRQLARNGYATVPHGALWNPRYVVNVWVRPK